MSTTKTTPFTATRETSVIGKATKGILFAALLAASACSGDKAQDERELPPIEKFPESVTTPSNDELTATMPSVEPVGPPPVQRAPEPALTKYSEFMARGRSRMQSGEGEGAVADFLQAIEMRPHSQHAQVQLARTLLSLDRADEAREHIESALELDGTSSLAWNTMGRVELAEGEYEAAIASFERATEEDPDNSYAWNNLGFVLIEEGLYGEAVAALEDATTGGTPKPYMWNNLGMAYEHLDQIALARAAYRQAGEGGSSKAIANFARLEGVESLIVAEVEADDSEEAMELVEAATERVSNPLGGPDEIVEVAEAEER